MTDRNKDGDHPAFPIAAGNQVYAQGISLRDWFAGQALAGMTANCDSTGINGWDGLENHAANYAYRLADAMLEARSDKK